MKIFKTALILISAALLVAACESTQTKKKRLPSRQTDASTLPWGKPTNWEGGIPGMSTAGGAAGNPSRY